MLIENLPRTSSQTLIRRLNASLQGMFVEVYTFIGGEECEDLTINCIKSVVLREYIASTKLDLVLSVQSLVFIV